MKVISPDFDVLVVGGGCAGLSAAISAAEVGARVLLAERRSEIGERIVCAEGVQANALKARYPISENWICAKIDRARFCASDGRVASLEKPESGFILDKASFLRSLKKTAQDKGVKIKTSCNVVLADLSEGSIEVRLGPERHCKVRSIVAADGIDSLIARNAGIQKALTPADLFVCAQAFVDGIELDANQVEFHLSNSLAPGGYAWVFPKGESRANVGVGMIAGGDSRANAYRFLKRFIEKRCANGKILRLVFGGVPSVARPFNGLGSGIFTAGDAARVADPVSGAGIIAALDSGRIAGEAAAKYALGILSLSDAEKAYHDGIRSIDRFRHIRFALRGMMRRMSEREISRFVAILDQFLSRGNSLDQPLDVLKYFVLRMPEVFANLAARIKV
ncbi:MAG: NAD(P)/FAD-dependent oxidoreductase [bacterium]